MTNKYDTNLPQHIRLRILDKLLASKKLTKQELMNRIIEELEQFSEVNNLKKNISYSPRTFEYDITCIKAKLAEINEVEDLHSNNSYAIVKEKLDDAYHYFYNQPHISVFEKKLGIDEITKLTTAVSLLKQIKGFDSDNEIYSILQGLDHQLKYQSEGGEQVICLPSAMADGYQYVDDLYHAIIGQTVVEIEYEPFTKTPTTVIIHPYYLKQYNNRWFLFALNHERNAINNFALDRFKKKPKPKPNLHYIIPKGRFDAENYFKDIIGVTNIADNEVEEILLQFSAQRKPYILSKKIHDSQKLVTSKPDGSITISLYLKQNFELEQFILGHGSHITVLQPASLKQNIKNHLLLAIANYDTDN
jgi:predicted DNA-binding transcriptional regulator YafY